MPWCRTHTTTYLMESVKTLQIILNFLWRPPLTGVMGTISKFEYSRNSHYSKTCFERWKSIWVTNIIGKIISDMRGAAPLGWQNRMNFSFAWSCTYYSNGFQEGSRQTVEGRGLAHTMLTLPWCWRAQGHCSWVRSFQRLTDRKVHPTRTTMKQLKPAGQGRRLTRAETMLGDAVTNEDEAN